MTRLFLACLLAIAPGCSDPPPSVYPTDTAFIEDTTLGTGDKLEVRIFYGSKEIAKAYRIGSHGEISVPHIGAVKVTGRTEDDVEAEIQRRLADGYLKEPIVSVNVTEFNSKKISVMGEVKNPGLLSYFEGMSILDAISQAGGFTGMARKNAVTVIRRQGSKKLKYTVPVSSITQNKARNFPMRPGDSINVPERVF